MAKTIEIIVSPTGETTIHAVGYSGTACKDATRSIEQAMGTVTKDQATPEMYQTAKQQVKQ